MPIDGFKVTVKNRAGAQRILRHPDLHFLKLVDEETGEDTNRYDRVRSNHLSYTPLPCGEMVIMGNLFQFHKGSNNLEAFSYGDVLAALDSFCSYHSLDAKDIEVNRLEVGFNLPSHRSAADIIGDIVTYKYRQKEVSTHRQTGLSAAFTFNEYRLMFYDKGRKHKLNTNLFRMELIAGRGLLKKKGINSLEDLYDRGKLASLCLHLKQSIGDMVFTDRSLDLKGLRAKELFFFQTYRTSEDWTSLQMSTKDNARKVRKRYQKLIEKHGGNHTQKWLLHNLDEAIEKHDLVQSSKNYRFSAVDKSGKSVTLTG